MEVLFKRKIVLLGKTRAGKSSLGNTIFGENVFEINHSTDFQSQVSRSVSRRSTTLIDTPGFFDTAVSEEQLRLDLLGCITECAPGPHAFFIVLKVERYTDQEEAFVKKILQYFPEEAFRYAAVVFTHGNQLPKRKGIQEFVSQSEGLSDLVRKCGGRCHVVDNIYWNNNQDDYRSNQLRVAELHRTILKIVTDNNGSCFTREMLQPVGREMDREEEREVAREVAREVEREVEREEEREVEREVEREEEREVQQEVEPQIPNEARVPAKISFHKKCMIKFAGVTTGAIVGACFSVWLTVKLAAKATVKIVNIADAHHILVGIGALIGQTAVGTGVDLAVAVGRTHGRSLGLSVAVIAGTGAVVGGVIGYDAAQGAEAAVEAAEKVACTVWDKGLAAAVRVKDSWGRI